LSHKVKDIVKLIEELAPPELTEPWDNVGLLAGDSNAPVNRVMVTLDITADVIKDAVQKQVDMIISHHPVLFKPIKAVNDTTVTGSQLLMLLQAGIAVYSAHTNLDKARGGTDDTLAELLGLQDIRILSNGEDGSKDSEQPGFGRIGLLPGKLPLELYLMNVKKELKAGNVDYIGDPEKEIQIIASCAGAGGDFMQLANAAGADLFITGELKYHEAISALDQGMAVAAFGHYATEQPAMGRLIQRLQNSVNALQYNIEVIPSKEYGNCFRRLRG
jgi:dinuclear metal center YbgI/SA1388 family protein